MTKIAFFAALVLMLCAAVAQATDSSSASGSSLRGAKSVPMPGTVDKINWYCRNYGIYRYMITPYVCKQNTGADV